MITIDQKDQINRYIADVLPEAGMTGDIGDKVRRFAMLNCGLKDLGDITEEQMADLLELFDNYEPKELVNYISVALGEPVAEVETEQATQAEQAEASAEPGALSANVSEPLAQEIAPLRTHAPKMAARGMLITPVMKGQKKPFLKGWQDSASSDLNQIAAWDKQFPGYNYGNVAKAVIGHSWFFEVDAAGVLDRIQSETGHDLVKEVPTYRVRSRQGRGHFYFKQTAASIAMGNLSQSYVKGNDWSARVNDEIVVGAGSYRENERSFYEELNPDAEILPAPDWLVEWLIAQKIEGKKSVDKGEPARNERGLIPRGYIHGWMVKQAGRLREMGLGGSTLEAALLELVHDNCEGPIDESKVKQVAASFENYPKGTNTELFFNQNQPNPSAVVEQSANSFEEAIEKESERVGIKIVSKEEFISTANDQPQTRWHLAACHFDVSHGKAHLFLSRGISGGFGYHCDVASCGGNFLDGFQKLTNGFYFSGRNHVDIRVAVEKAERKGGEREDRPFDYEGIIPSGVYCLWLGAMKAEKSLFALRKAMHDACGRGWLNCRNLAGPVKVLYFDSENDSNEVDDRWDEMITEFSPREQKLIEQNLAIVKGKTLARDLKIAIEYENKALWQTLHERYPDARVVYLDCWYQLQNIKATDAPKQKAALEAFEEYFPGRTLFLLHHTGREESESLQKKKPVGLRELGANRWSNKVSQSVVVLKKAEIIICQEKRFEIDEEGVTSAEFIDFMVYSRNAQSTPLLSYEPVYCDEDREYKYRRAQVVTLSTSAGSALTRLQKSGPWPSAKAIAAELGGTGGRQYQVVRELQFKGYLVKTDTGFCIRGSGRVEVALSQATMNPMALKQAYAFLKKVLATGPMAEPKIHEMAKAEGILLGNHSLYEGVRQYLGDDGWEWSLNVKDEEMSMAKQIRRLIDAEPTISKKELMAKASCSEWLLNKAIKSLGIKKDPGRNGAWKQTAQ